MIRIENTGVYGFEAAIRGMRNPMNSWDKSDSHVCACADGYLDCPMVLNDDEPANDRGSVDEPCADVIWG